MTREDQIEARAASGEATVDTMMADYSEDAVNHARTMGEILDYSVDSLKKVERILTKLADAQPKGIAKLFRKSPTQTDIEDICRMYGGYIGEVMRFEWGGEWIIPDDGHYAGELVVKSGDSMVSPPAKVYKRLTGGPGQDIFRYYQVLTQLKNEDSK